MVPDVLGELATHEFVSLDEIHADAAAKHASARAVEQDQSQLAALGADESRELAVRSTTNGSPVTPLLRTLRYGDHWWLETLGGMFALILGVPHIDSGVIVGELPPGEPGSTTSTAG
jgi:hypothetical protein